MKLTFTKRQTEAVWGLSPTAFRILQDLIERGGAIATQDLDQYYQLKQVKLVKCSKSSVRVNFAIDGVIPQIFLGHRKKKSAGIPQVFIAVFSKAFKEKFLSSYVVLAADWGMANQVCRQYDPEELEWMVESYMSRVHESKASIKDFMMSTKRLFRAGQAEILGEQHEKPRARTRTFREIQEI